MEVHTNSKYSDLLSKKQWAEKGRMLNENVQGKEMWINSHHQGTMLYYDENQTHKASPDELEQYRVQIKAERNARQREQRARKKQRDKERVSYLENRLEAECRIANVYRKELDNLINEYPEMLKGTIVIDVETTGMDLNTDEILQLSVIDGDGNTLYNHHFKPIRVKKWDTAQTDSGITPETVANCPYLFQESEYIIPILQSAAVIIGYNIGFALGMLGGAGIHYASKSKIVDVMREHSVKYGEWDDEINSYKLHSLSECADYYGYESKNDNAHDSLSKCRATLFCHKKLHKLE